MPQLDPSRDSTTKLITVVEGDYYGGSSAAVPFKWESQPGTPRRLFKKSSCSGFDSDSDSNYPVSAPLTPPPSYYSASPCSSTKPINPKKTNNRFGSLLSKNRSVLSSSSSSSSPTSSVPSSPLRTSDSNGRNRQKHYNGKSLGCYASIIKVMLLRDVK